MHRIIWIALYEWGMRKGYAHSRCGMRDYCNLRKRLFPRSFRAGWWEGFDDGHDDLIREGSI